MAGRNGERKGQKTLKSFGIFLSKQKDKGRWIEDFHLSQVVNAVN